MPTVLLVDNEPALLETFRYTLEHCGCTVLSALSGESALRVCHAYAGRIDVLVADVVMEGISGFEIAAIVKSAHPSAAVILMSGSPPDIFPQFAIANEFLEKPFALRELLTTISRYVAIPEGVGATHETWN